ncbi:hypothetical protein GCM10022419_084030 [Nonomuraea rosea]|uniref:Uncharacterized protein n=1 Tax=Nonomuraea rosea TaxID=638574 RepID=A0ABP6YVF9_9ACTN
MGAIVFTIGYVAPSNGAGQRWSTPEGGVRRAAVRPVRGSQLHARRTVNATANNRQVTYGPKHPEARLGIRRPAFGGSQDDAGSIGMAPACGHGCSKPIRYSAAMT